MPSTRRRCVFFCGFVPLHRRRRLRRRLPRSLLLRLVLMWAIDGEMEASREDESTTATEGRIAQAGRLSRLLSSATIPPVHSLTRFSSSFSRSFDQKWPSGEITSKSLSFGASCTWRCAGVDLPEPPTRPQPQIEPTSSPTWQES